MFGGDVTNGQDIGRRDGGIELDLGCQGVGAALGQKAFFDADLCVEGFVFHLKVEQPKGDVVGCGKGLEGVVDGLAANEDT